jgi:NAD(P)H-hydrate epimerase
MSRAEPNRPAAESVPSCAADSVSWISVAQMREVDRTAIEIGLSLTRMMENAGANLAWLARTMLGGDVGGRRIVVLAGRGGNGGGGLVAARRLIGWGADVEVRLASEPDKLAPVPLEQFRLLAQMGARMSVGAERIAPPELFLDAILGYSLRGDPNRAAAELIAATEGARVLSLDVPSGVELEHGIVRSPAVRADATLTLALPKAALRLEDARALAGDLCLGDISIPAVVYEHLGIPYRSPFSRGPIVRLV